MGVNRRLPAKTPSDVGIVRAAARSIAVLSKTPNRISVIDVVIVPKNKNITKAARIWRGFLSDDKT